VIFASIVIPCHGRLASLRRAVESVERSCDEFGEPVEIILVDDASPVPVSSAFGQPGGRVRVVTLDRNRGASAARNMGIAAARGPIVLFTDDDVVVHELWVRSLSVYLRDAPARVAAVGGRVLALGDDIFSRYYEYHHILDPFLMDDGTVLYVTTCNCAYRRSTLVQVGGFDEALRKPGGEDPGLSFKVTAAGYELHRHDEAVVWHDFRPGLPDFLRTFCRYGAGCRHQADRHWKGARGRDELQHGVTSVGVSSTS